METLTRTSCRVHLATSSVPRKSQIRRACCLREQYGTVACTCICPGGVMCKRWARTSVASATSDAAADIPCPRGHPGPHPLACAFASWPFRPTGPTEPVPGSDRPRCPAVVSLGCREKSARRGGARGIEASSYEVRVSGRPPPRRGVRVRGGAREIVRGRVDARAPDAIDGSPYSAFNAAPDRKAAPRGPASCRSSPKKRARAGPSSLYDTVIYAQRDRCGR